MASSSSPPSAVSVVASSASLLSGDLDECFNATDTTCEAGFAAVSAYTRQQEEPLLVIPQLDKTSPFVQMHPLKWAVNLLILQGLLNFSVFVSTPSILTSGNDLTLLASTALPLLLTNVVVPPSSVWQSPFSQRVHFDPSTSLAVLSIADSNTPLNWPQVSSAQGALDYIARINARQEGCSDNDNTQSFESTLSEAINDVSVVPNDETCWTPVIYYADTSIERFDDFVSAITAHPHPPAVIIDLEVGHSLYMEQPILVNTTWVYSYLLRSDSISIVSLTFNEERKVTNVTVATKNLEELPEEYKDDTYVQQIQYLRTLADEAEQNDPIVGETTTMPAIRDREMTTYRRCKGGECEMGNLFTDALRWYTGVDVTFITSGGLRGYGWLAGPVHVSDLFGALPFPNNPCLGTMNGISLFRLLNYTTSVSSFQSGDTDEGGRLLQVSGMRYTYNTNLNQSRLVAVDVWNEEQGDYLPLDRLQLYTFATDSYLCGDYTPYPSLLTDELQMDEEPGVIDDSILHQTIVGEYLTQLPDTYQTGIEGRLRNDTEATVVLNLIQTKDSCPPNSYWNADMVTCQACPDASNVAFSDEKLEFEVESGSMAKTVGRVVLVNRELYPVSVVPKSIPQWFDFIASSDNSTKLAIGGTPVELLPGESIAVEFEIETSALEAGTAQGTVSFGILDVGGGRGCIGQDTSFAVFVRVSPHPELNQLTTGVRAAGMALMAIIVCASLFFALWVICKRKERVVRTLQPLFLFLICFGVFVIGSSILPMSIDDSVASQRGCDIACMSTPWLLSMGSVVSFSALFSKLWRINKLFNARAFQRIQVREKDVLLPFVVLFVLNFSFMLTWTLVDPLRWLRGPVNESPWNSYGRCTGSGAVSIAMVSLVACVNIGALLFACFQAFRARNISDEFSESKYLGIALYSWFQLLLVGVPVMFLIDDSNPTARYFLQVALIFAICMSMLLLLFTPLLLNWWNARRRARNSDNVRVSGLSENARIISATLASSATVERSFLGHSSKSSDASDLVNDSNAGKFACDLSTLQEVSSDALSPNPSGAFTCRDEENGVVDETPSEHSRQGGSDDAGSDEEEADREVPLAVESDSARSEATEEETASSPP